MVSEELPARIDQWVAAGIITAEQADLIRAEEPGAATTAATPHLAESLAAAAAGPDTTAPDNTAADTAGDRHASVLAEALAYLGIVVTLIASALVIATVGPSIRQGTAIGLTGLLTGALWAAAPRVPLRLGASAVRIRSAMLLTSSGTVAVLIGVGASSATDWMTADDSYVTGSIITPPRLALVITGGTLLASAVLWRLNRRLPQHAAVLWTALVLAGIATTYLPHDSVALAGLAIWAVAAGWFALSWAALIVPRRGGMLLSAIAALLGAEVVTAPDTWQVLAIVTLAAVFGVAIISRDMALVAIATVGSVQIIPAVAVTHFQHALGYAIAMLAAGAVLVLAAVLAVRRRNGSGPDAQQRRDWSTVPARAGMASAGLIAAGAAAVVLAVGF